MAHSLITIGRHLECAIQTLLVVVLKLALIERKQPSRGGAVLYRLSPQLGEDPPVEDPRVCDPPGEPGWLSW